MIRFKGLLLGTVCIAVLSGCTTYNDKFKNKKVANIGLFADSTITMLSDLNLSLKKEETILTRRFIEDGGAEEEAVKEMAGSLKRSLGNTVRYSIEIVNIAELDIAETNKIEIYADYLVKFRDTATAMESVDEELFDDTIEEIMEQEDFLKALRKAQPIMNMSIIEASLKAGDLIEAVQELSTKLDRRIDEEYEDIIRYRAKLEHEKFDIMTAFELIYDAYRDNEPNLDELRTSGVIWTPEIIPEGRPTREDLAKIGEHLQARMEALHLAQDMMKQNWDDYLAAHREVDQITDEIVKSVHEARILMLTWVRAHQKMSSGTVDSAKWFDIGEVTKSLIVTAPKAVL